MSSPLYASASCTAKIKHRPLEDATDWTWILTMSSSEQSDQQQRRIVVCRYCYRFAIELPRGVVWYWFDSIAPGLNPRITWKQRISLNQSQRRPKVISLGLAGKIRDQLHRLGCFHWLQRSITMAIISQFLHSTRGTFFNTLAIFLFDFCPVCHKNYYGNNKLYSFLGHNPPPPSPSL